MCLSENITHTYIYLTSEKTLKIQKAVREGNACRITNTSGAEVSDGGGAERGVVGEDVEEDIVE